MLSALTSKSKRTSKKYQRVSEPRRAAIEMAKQIAKLQRAVMEKAQADEDQQTLLRDQTSTIYSGYP